MTDTRPNWRQRGYDRTYDRNRRRLLRSGDDTCHICGEPIDMTLSGRHRDGPTVDHIVPRARGGTNDVSNLRLAHLRCNAGRPARERPTRRRAAEDHPGLIDPPEAA